MRVPPNHACWDSMMEKLASPACWNCFFVELGEHTRLINGTIRETWFCHRHAPRPMSVDDDTCPDCDFVARWPEVREKQWCGDWEPDEDLDIVHVDIAEKWAQEAHKRREAAAAPAPVAIRPTFKETMAAKIAELRRRRDTPKER